MSAILPLLATPFRDFLRAIDPSKSFLNGVTGASPRLSITVESYLIRLAGYASTRSSDRGTGLTMRTSTTVLTGTYHGSRAKLLHTAPAGRVTIQVFNGYSRGTVSTLHNLAVLHKLKSLLGSLFRMATSSAAADFQRRVFVHDVRNVFTAPIRFSNKIRFRNIAVRQKAACDRRKNILEQMFRLICYRSYNSRCMKKQHDRGSRGLEIRIRLLPTSPRLRGLPRVNTANGCRSLDCRSFTMF